MKARGFFLLLLLFTGACFAWWVVQLDRLQQANLRMQERLLYAQVEEAQNQMLLLSRADSDEHQAMIMHVSGTTRFISLSNWKQIINAFPSLHIESDQNKVGIQPTRQAIAKIQTLSTNNRTRLIAESSLFFGLLFIGFIWIYKGLVDAIELNQQQSNFLISVTHELKTPIATSRLLFDTLYKYKLDEGKVLELSESGIQNTVHQLELVESLLIANRLDTNTYEGPKERVNLSAWLYDELDLLQHDFPKNLSLLLDFDERIEAEIDVLSFRLSISNLISNAIKYGGESNKISLKLSRQSGYALLQIGDEGPGIPDQDKKRIFKKFYRRGDAYTQAHRGTGLGLFIVAETAKRHGGKVWVEDREPTGSMFNILIQSL